MAGGYTHITVVQDAAAEIRQQQNLLHDEARLALSRWLKYTIIGSVGPDYPYLDLADRSSEQWATAMHTASSLDVIRECVRLIRPMSNELIRQKCMAWLFGFASKKYDPIEDLDADHWNSLRIKTHYYNTDLHKGSFYLPNYVKELLGRDE